MADSVLDRIRAKAKSLGRRIVLTETDDPRNLKAAAKIVQGGYAVPVEHVLPEYRKEMPVKVCVRPEELVISNTDEGVDARIDDSVFLGLNTHYFVTTADGIKAEIVQESQIDSIIPKGEHVRLTVKREKINIMTEDGSTNILQGVQNDLEQKAV